MPDQIPKIFIDTLGAYLTDMEPIPDAEPEEHQHYHDLYNSKYLIEPIKNTMVAWISVVDHQDHPFFNLVVGAKPGTHFNLKQLDVLVEKFNLKVQAERPNVS